ncbi:MAG TPA: TetR/AcrR family transcriptional regulator [Gemmatimonadales bacterium]|nr:TetR/AcrR family transcriptional regulator [Gemmatimonadales bacterium]HRZ08746.1 TetR/AcrR family transcriptional regulator [Gemmatimonadales bacterium]
MTAPTTPLPGRRDGEGTRQKLLRAALELFTGEGFLASTTPLIAERAGVAEGTIYRHFTSKEHLLNEVFRGTQRWATGVVKEVDADRTLKAPDRLARIARRFVETAERDPAGARMLLRQRDGKFLDAPSRDAAREFREAVQQIVAAGKADGMVRAGPAELWTSVWLVILAFIIERVSAREWTMDQPQVAQAIEAAWSAIAAPAQPGPGRTSSPEGPAAEG